MTRAVIEIRGLDKLEAKLKAASREKFLKLLKKGVLLNASECQQKMQTYAAVDTGTMKRSVSLNVGTGGMSAKVAPQTDYAVYVEYGTRFMTAQPFVRPAFNEQKPTFLKDMRSVVKKIME